MSENLLQGGAQGAGALAGGQGGGEPQGTPQGQPQGQAGGNPPGQPQGQGGEKLPLIDDGGQLDPQWFERFDGTREYGRRLQKFTSLEGLGKTAALLESQRTPPGPDAPEEVVQAYRQVVGIDPEKYGEQVTAPEDLPEGIEVTPEYMETVRKLGLEHNMTPDQVKAWVAHDVSQLQRIQQQIADQAAEDLEARRARLADYAKEQKVDLQTLQGTAMEVAVALGLATPEQAAGKEEMTASWAKEPDAVKMLYTLHQRLSEHSLHGVDGGRGNAPLLSGTGNYQEAEKLTSHPGWLDTSHPEHESLHRKWGQLMQAHMAVSGQG